MTRITIDPSTAAQLAGLEGAVELCDPSGNSVGLFQPMVTRSTAANTPEFSPKQLDAFAGEPGGRGLDEILADLEERQ